MRARFEADGDVIVITGGANGIGRALALAAAAARAQTVVCDVDRAAMDSLVAEDARIAALPLDVADRDAVLAAFAAIEREHGRIDGLVCGAAVQPRTAVAAMGPAEWQRVLA